LVHEVKVEGDKVDVDKAIRLKRIVARERAKYTTGPPNLSTWAKHFRRLRRHVPCDQVERVLDWYEGAIGGEYVPQAYNAKSFREKYPALLSAMRRAKGHATDVEAQAVSPDGQGVCDRLRLAWPNGEAEQAPALATQTHSAYKAFRTFLREHALDSDGMRGLPLAERKDSRWRFLAGILCERLPSADSYTEGWLKAMHKMATTWDKWNGNLLRQQWHPEHKRFLKYIAYHIDDEPRVWARLLEEWRESEKV
jgi:hypothetical protein